MRTPITWGKGLNADVLPSELADGFWSGASNVRVSDGFAKRIPGTVWGAGTQTPPSDATWLFPYYSSLSSDGVHLILATRTKVYVTDQIGFTTDISPYAEGVTITNMTRVGTTVTVTAPAHGRSTGNVVSVWGAVPSTYNVESASITVTGVNTFTYVVPASPAVSPATSFGLWSYGTTNQSLDLNFAARATGGELGGVFYLNHPTQPLPPIGLEGLFYWAGDVTIPMRRVPNSYSARVSRTFGDYVLQLGPRISGVDKPQLLVWSSATEQGTTPSAFVSAVGNDAGSVPVNNGGDLVDSCPLGDMNILYTQRGRIGMRNISPANEVFSFVDLPGTDGLFASGCVVDTPVGHVFLNQNLEVMLHSGGPCRNLSKGRVQSLIRSPTSSYFGVFLTVNSARNEVWIFCCSPTTASTALYPTQALVWNWVDDTWGIRDYGSLEIFYGINRKTSSGQLLFTGCTTIGVGDDDVDGQPRIGNDLYTSYVERAGLDLGDRDRIKNLQRSRWNTDAASGQTFSIQHGASMTADGTPAYTSAVTATHGTSDYVAARATGGRFVALKCSWQMSGLGASNPGSIRTTDLDVTAGGKR